jgi:hypothetical protein
MLATRVGGMPTTETMASGDELAPPHPFLPKRRTKANTCGHPSLSLVAAGAAGFFTSIQSGDVLNER